MREIKFRGKCIPEFPHPVAKWVYGSFVSDNLILSPYKERNENRHFWYMVDPDTVGQFTGLLDCDGREIFEGDILSNGNDVVVIKYKPEWASFIGFYYGRNDITLCLDECVRELKIIGNIHDDPKLLEVAHD